MDGPIIRKLICVNEQSAEREIVVIEKRMTVSSGNNRRSIQQSGPTKIFLERSKETLTKISDVHFRSKTGVNFLKMDLLPNHCPKCWEKGEVSLQTEVRDKDGWITCSRPGCRFVQK